MLAHPPAQAVTVGVGDHVERVVEGVGGWPFVVGSELVTTHDSGQAIVVGQHESRGHAVLPRTAEGQQFVWREGDGIDALSKVNGSQSSSRSQTKWDRRQGNRSCKMKVRQL